jgi:hypothetical protein
VKVPGVEKVTEADDPGAIGLASVPAVQPPLSDVAVCGSELALLQLTVVPAGTVSINGR